MPKQLLSLGVEYFRMPSRINYTHLEYLFYRREKMLHCKIMDVNSNNVKDR